MKKILFVLIMACIATASRAGDINVISGDLSVIRNSSITATVRFDYGALYIEGLPYKEHLQRRGSDFVANWASESQMAEEYFIKCWNHDNDRGLQLAFASRSEYTMVIVVNNMDMGSGAASYFVGFGAGGAKMDGMMYLFKGTDYVPLLTVEIDGQTGRSGLTEMVRRNDLYGELAEDMVKAIEKTKASRVRPSTTAVTLPSVTLYGESSASAPQVTEPAPVVKETLRPSTPTRTETPRVSASTTKETPARTTRTETTRTNANSDIPLTVQRAESYLRLDRRGMAGNFSVLKSESRMSVYLDFSDAIIDHRTEEEFIEYMIYGARERERDPQFAETWETSVKPSLLHKFIGEVNEQLDDERLSLVLVTRQGCPYTLKIKVLEVNDDGDNKCDYLVVETATGDVIAHIRYEADGGSFGRFVGLLEQGMETAGEEFGEIFAKKIRRDR